MTAPTRNTLLVIAIVSAFLLGGLLAWSLYKAFAPVREVVRTVVPEVIVTDKPTQPNVLPPDYLGKTPPPQVIVTPVEWPTTIRPDGTQTVIVRDTIRVPVPEAIARDSSIRLTADNPVTVHKPLFGNPSISVATYSPERRQYETLRYSVPEHPLKYGASVGVYGQRPILALDSLGGATTYGAEGELYLGWRAVQGFGRVDINTEGAEARVGVRLRLGR